MITQATLDRLQEGLETPLKEVIRVMRRERKTWEEIAEWFEVDVATITDAAKHYKIYGRRPPRGTNPRATRAEVEHAAEVTGYTIKTVLTLLYRKRMTMVEVMQKRRTTKRPINWEERIGMPLAEYLRRFNPTASTSNIADRLHNGWDIDTAISTPVRKRNGKHAAEDNRRAA